MVKKGLAYYLRLPYTITLKRGVGDGEEYWIARVLELPHCMTHGETPEEALSDIQDAKKEWLKSNLADGLPIPEPTKFTGQYHLRMPPSLHEALTIKSQNEDVSLNQLMIAALARSVGYAEQPKRKSARTPELGEIGVISEIRKKSRFPGVIRDAQRVKTPKKQARGDV